LNESRGALNATLLEREVLEAVYKKTKMNVFRISCRKTFSYSYLRSKGVFFTDWKACLPKRSRQA